MDRATPELTQWVVHPIRPLQTFYPWSMLYWRQALLKITRHTLALDLNPIHRSFVCEDKEESTSDPNRWEI